MSKHTQEPWKVCHWKDDRRGFEIADRNQSRVGFDMTEASARRIVACVNACAGVSNGELAMTTMSVVLARMNEAEQQRDELLAALEEAKSVLSSINTGRQHKVEVEDDEPAFWQRNEWVTWAKGEILPMIEAAIAKAKGGAA